MNNIEDLKTAWNTFYASINSILEKFENDFKEVDSQVAKRSAETKLLDDKFKQLAEDKQQLIFDRDMLEKERLVLKEKKEQLDMLDKKLQVKADRLQKILAD